MQVVKFIGKGSFGSVYRVRRLSDGMDYAMKQINVTQMNSQERKKAINEIRILASVASCPYLVRFYEAFLENDTLYIVTDYAAQGDLLSHIKRHYKRRTHFPERQCWSYLIQVVQRPHLAALGSLNLLATQCVSLLARRGTSLSVED